MAQEGLNYVNNTLLDIENKNNYLYNGKEQDGQTKFFEYGFRDYDSQLGRWHVRDPMAETYANQSPYHFAGNNPVGNREVNGAVYQSLEKQDWERGVNESGVLRGSNDFGNVSDDFWAGTAMGEFLATHTYMEGTEGSGYVPNSDIIPVSNSRNGCSAPEKLASSGISGYYTSSKGKIYILNIDGIGELDFDGIDISGSEGFINNVTLALNRIYNTHLGKIVLDGIKNGPRLTISSSLFINEFFPYQINFAGVYSALLMPGIEATIQNYYETNLGHELWHAFQCVALGNENYMALVATSEGYDQLQRGAVAFENYLASVLYGTDWVRTNEGIKGRSMEFFNRFNERLTLNTVTSNNGNRHIAGWQNSVTLTPEIARYYQNIANSWIRLN